MQKKKEIVNTLLAAMPYVDKFNENVIIISINSAFNQLDDELKKSFAEDIVLLKMMGLKPIIIHSGNKERVLELATKLNCLVKYDESGCLIVSDAIMKVEELVLSGEINREIVSLLNYFGAKSIGLSGKDSKFIQATPINDKCGLVGEITNINEKILLDLVDRDIIPVVTPVATGEFGLKSFRVSSAHLAGELGLKIGSNKIIFLIGEDGIMDNTDELISSLNVQEAEELLKSNIGYMPNKYIKDIMEIGVKCVKSTVDKVHIVNASINHSLLLEIFTDDGIGTEIV